MNHVLLLPLLAVPGGDDTPVDFRRDVRPILSDKCFTCHGPDDAVRKGKLRLDLSEVLDDERRIIVANDASASELIARITDDLDPMPPEDADRQLTASEKEILARWIDEGATWSEHWSFLPVERPASPEVSDASWARHDLDRFVLARLEAEGIAPSAEAGRETLLRRASFDLTGLPPTVEEIDAFLADDRPDAYEHAVDRLLASPRYGEHMAREWLDAARYGDTHGLHLDNERSLWRWRDWVIEAFNENVPFDRFTIEQLAGDLLPDATDSNRIATGFNRCNATTGEGGLIAEEYLVHYAVDRVNTTSTVWMGLTMACAQCHDHKYDPFTQREYYELLAFFNGLAENASDANALVPPPALAAPSPEQRNELEGLDAALAVAHEKLNEPMPESDLAQAAWEVEERERLQKRWRVARPVDLATVNGTQLDVQDDDSVLASGDNPDRETFEILLTPESPEVTGIRLEALTHESFVNGGVGRATNANIVLSKLEVDVVSGEDGTSVRPVALASAIADFSQDSYPIAATLDEDPETGWAIAARAEDRTAVFSFEEETHLAEGEALRVRMRHDSRHVKHTIGRFRLATSSDIDLTPPAFGDWHVIGPFASKSAFKDEFGPEADARHERSHGELEWEARPEFVDGAIHSLLPGTNCATYLAREITSAGPRDVTLSLGSDDGIIVWLNGEKVLEKDVARPVAADQESLRITLRDGRNDLLMKIVNRGGGFAFYFDPRSADIGGLPLDVAAAVTAEEQTDEQRLVVRDFYRARHSPEWKAVQDEITALDAKRAEVDGQVPRTMVMAEREMPRPTYVLERGSYLAPGEEVHAGFPAVLASSSDPEVANRLALAEWLVDGEHPLTARVHVNRVWQHHFGTGLVATSEDFGAQGEYPSHPELLDHLASEFVASGWDVKALHRSIVTSATYRQRSATRDDVRERDPDNRLLWRGPCFRLDAEAIRDTALFVSGLLVEQLGGKSVRPYQPSGIWKAVGYTSSNTANFRRDDGDALWRRSMYTFWKRTAPPPSMALFDAPSRESCTVKRDRTNTPLQALTLMNDIQFVEAARVFGERILKQGGATDAERIEWAFRSVTGRRPRADERTVLERFLSESLIDFASDAEAAGALVSVGEAMRDASIEAPVLAAWTQLASILLNLDETVTKG